MLNKTVLIGRLGQDPEVFTFESGDKVAKLNIATDDSYKNKKGEKVEVTDWHNVVIKGPSVNFVERFLTKGALVYVEGKNKVRSYQDKDGVNKYISEVIGFVIKSLGGQADQARAVAEAPPSNEVNGEPDDLPF